MPNVAEQNWHPQGVDTRNSGINHIYIPRYDGHVGGQPAVHQPGGIAVPVVTYLGAPPGAPFHDGVSKVPVEIKPDGHVYALVPPGNYPVPGPVPQPINSHPYPYPYPYPPPQPVYYPGGVPAPLPGGNFGGNPGCYPGPGPGPAALPAPQNYPYYHHQNVPGVNNYPNAYVQPGTYANGSHYTNHIQQPAINAIGLTGQEIQERQIATAHGTNINEPQDMKPADDDPQRWYWVRDLEGVYTQYSRMMIDGGALGKIKWYVVDGGTFYAVQLPN